MITITLQNQQSEFQKVLNDNIPFGHYLIAELFPILVNMGGIAPGSTSDRLVVKSPLPLRLNSITSGDSHMIIFKFDKNKYSFDDIIPRFMDYLGRVFIIEDLPSVDENYNLIFQTTDFDSASMIFPVETNSGEYLFICYLHTVLCELNKEKFDELEFPENEFETRLDNAAESLYNEFK